MKAKTQTKPHKPLPSVSQYEIEETLTKAVTINLRLSVKEKDRVKRTAQAFGLNVSQYLLKCHELVADKEENRTGVES